MNPDKWSPEQSRWINYYEKTRDAKIPAIILKALEFVTQKDKAIDIGAGSLRDTRFLIEQGFHVTALDSSYLLPKEAEGLPEDKLDLANCLFEDFDFPENKYDFVVSILSLFFIKPENFDTVFKNIKTSLKKGGILCVSFSGKNSTIANINNGSTHTRDEIEEMLTGMEIITFKETDTEEILVNGQPVNKHVFSVIAKKL